MILVTGASGFVGGHLVRRLAGEGTPVRGLVRDRSRSRLPPGVEVVEGDLTRPESLAEAVRGARTVVHAAAITANLKEPYEGAYEAVNRRGTENLVAASAKAGVRRLVAMSGLGTQPARPGTYMATRWAAEQAVRESGLPYVILQPSVLFGDGAEFVTALARVIRLSPVAPMLGGGDLLFQPLWIEDLVTCLVRATPESAPSGRTVPLGGSEVVTQRELLSIISQAVGKRRLLLPLPLGAARLQASLMAALLPRPPLTPATLELFTFPNATSPDAVEREFGFRPRGFREHLLRHGIEG